VISRLKENADRAMQAARVIDKEGKETGEYTWQPSAANRALELIGKELGMFVDRKEIGTRILERTEGKVKDSLQVDGPQTVIFRWATGEDDLESSRIV
jgi:hypothetical protein